MNSAKKEVKPQREERNHLRKQFSALGEQFSKVVLFHPGAGKFFEKKDAEPSLGLLLLDSAYVMEAGRNTFVALARSSLNCGL